MASENGSENNNLVLNETTLGNTWDKTCVNKKCTLIVYPTIINYYNGSEYITIDTVLKSGDWEGYDYASEIEESYYQTYFKSHLFYGDSVKYCKDTYCFTMQPSKITYRDSVSSNDNIFSSPNSSVVGYSNNNKFVWENVFGNYSLSYTYNVDSLKETLSINSKPREPAVYLTNNITLDFEMYIKIPVGVKLYSNGEQIIDNTITSEKIIFTNSTDELYFLPKPYAVDNLGLSVPLQYEIVWDKSYNPTKESLVWFYVKTPYDWLNSSSTTYPVRIDPSVKYNAEEAGSGEVTYDSTVSWDAVHDAENGNDVYHGSSFGLDVFDKGGVSYNPLIRRGFLVFNTSSITDNSIINEVILCFTVWDPYSDEAQNDFITVVQSFQTVPTNISLSDYNKCGDTLNNVTELIDLNERKDVSEMSNGDVICFTFNGTGNSVINDTGYTKLGLREGHDILDVPITEDGDGVGMLIETVNLTIDYEEPSPNIATPTINATVILENESVRINVTVTSIGGNDTVDKVWGTIQYPNSTSVNYSFTQYISPYYCTNKSTDSNCSICDVQDSCTNCSEANCSWMVNENVADYESWTPNTDYATYQGKDSGWYAASSSSLCINDDDDECACFDENNGEDTWDNITKQTDLDLSGCVAGSANLTVAWMENAGTLEPDDCIRVYFSNDSGVTWGNLTVVGTCDDVGFPGVVSVTVPIDNSYLTSNFRMRFTSYNDNGGSAEAMCMDGLTVECEGSYYCEGLLNCSVYSNETGCTACSQCSWVADTLYSFWYLDFVDTFLVGTYNLIKIYANDTSSLINFSNTNLAWQVPETIPPHYSENSTNSTLAGSMVEHRLQWQDNTNLSGYIFSFCNGTWNGSECTNTSSLDWYNSSWSHRIKITINSSLVGENLTDYPIYVNLSDLPVDFHNNVNSTGKDIRITLSDGITELPREVVFYNETTNAGELYFKGNLSSAINTTFYVYYGNLEVEDYERDYTYGLENVWNANYLIVYHLQEEVNNDEGGYKDSTFNKYHGNGTSMTITAPQGFLAGKAAEFDGSADMIKIQKLFTNTNWSVSALVNIQALSGSSGNPIIYQGSGSSDLGTEFGLIDNYPSAGVQTFFARSGGATLATGIDVNYTTGEWHYYAGTFENTVVIFYYDDISAGSSTVSGDVHSNNDCAIAAWYLYSDENRFLDGVIDEVRVTNNVLTSDWLKTEYNNYKYLPSFYSFSTQENYSSSIGWVNDSWQAFPIGGTLDWSNVTKGITSEVGVVVAWCVYANDTSNNWNASSCDNPFVYNTTTLVVDDYSFTISYPAQGCTEGNGSTDASEECEKCAFISDNVSGIYGQKVNENNVSCEGQNLTVSFFKMTNTGNVALDFTMKLNASVNTSTFRIKASQNETGWEAICTDTKPPISVCVYIEDTTPVTVASNIGTGNFEEIWYFADFIEVQTSDLVQYEVTSTSSKS